MTSELAAEIAANLERAQHSIRAAQELLTAGYCDFAASRAYYAAFYAATALLLTEAVESSKHSGVIASVHQRFVKTGKLSKEQGKTLNWLFELRGVGDYGVTEHVSRPQAQQAVESSQGFLNSVKSLVQKAKPA